MVLPRAELVEIVEGETEEPAEEVFHGFEQEEVEEALELQAMFRENNAERLVEEIMEQEVEILPERRKNLSPRERKKKESCGKSPMILTFSIFCLLCFKLEAMLLLAVCYS